MRRLAWVGALVLGIGLIGIPRAQAVITQLTSLRDVLQAQELIFTVKVMKLDPDKPAMILLVDEELKGKAPFRQLPVNLKGDSEAAKHKQTPLLLKRLAPELPLVVFASPRGTEYTAFAYTNGTWFQLVGFKPSDSDPVRWAFTHGEPYLRRTFKGTTAEMRQTVIDGLSGKKKPPEPNEKEPPGFGPEIESKPAGDKDQKQSGHAPLPYRDGPPLAVIPTVLIGGPITILALLFPAVFGGLLLVMRRWVAVLTVASLNSTLFLLHGWLAPAIKTYWWGTPLALWVAMSSLTVAGLLWAWRRHRAAIHEGQPIEGPRRLELIVLGVLALTGIGMIAYCLIGHHSLLAPAQKTMLVVWVGVWVGTLYALYRRWTGDTRPILSIEGVMLGAMAFASLGLMAATWPRSAGATGVKVAWIHEVANLKGRVASTVLADGDRLYAAASIDHGLVRYGVLYCLDRNTGEVVWEFDNGGSLKQVFSSPCLVGGKLYVGEGFHQDNFCKLYCLDAATGKKLWHVQTESHTESSPLVVDGKVYFGAGADGMYCVDAENGKVVWHFEGRHVDSNPVIVENRLYGGSGYDNFEVFCLDKDTGNPLWRLPVNLPAFATPAGAGERVIFGLGNGNLTSSDVRPAGALLCVDGKTGNEVWRCDVGDGVHRRPAIDDQHVYCATRDWHVYCVRLSDGSVAWRKDVGAPVATAVALSRGATAEEKSGLYVVTQRGLVICLDPDTAQEQWKFNVAADANRETNLLSSPVVRIENTAQGPRRRIYFGTELINVFNTPAVYCLEERN